MRLIRLTTLNAGVVFALGFVVGFSSFAETCTGNLSNPFVCGRLSDSARYERLNPRFKKVFDFLQNTDLNTLPDGKVEIDGVEDEIPFEAKAGLHAAGMIMEVGSLSNGEEVTESENRDAVDAVRAKVKNPITGLVTIGYFVGYHLVRIISNNFDADGI